MSILESQLITDNTQLWFSDAVQHSENRVLQRLRTGELLRILGPCALQSVDQIVDILQLADEQLDVVRAPGKKPRTRPVSTTGERLFEGIGLAEANSIYQQVLQSFPHAVFASEVMSGEDLFQLESSISLGWVGSRTQQQETCRDIGFASEQTQIPIMVKNPMTADLELFLGMIENTILGSNNAVPLLICLRGTAPVNNTERNDWRNVPNLDWLPLLNAAFPDLPVIIDPSHMLKKQELTAQKVSNIVSEAVDKGARGYIIEVNTPAHPSLTDPGVNVTEMLDLLVQHNLT